ITLSTREKQLYGQLWAVADKDNNGFITGADAVPFFAKSGLSPQVLGEIWVLADADNKGVLGQQGFSIAVKLIAHAQNGKTPSASLIDTDAPLPHFEGITPAKISSPVATHLSPLSAQNTGSEPTLTADDKNKYGGMFVACGPVGGLLEGDKAREVFLKSKLPVDKLSQIWSLADTKQRGSLDITDFTIAMYYIQHTMDGSIKNLPSVLPSSVLKACGGSGAVTGAGLVSSPILSAQPLNRQLTGSGIGAHNPTIARQMTGSIGLSSSPLSKQNTGGANNLFGGSSTDIPWDVTPEEKAKFDRFFDQLDKTNSGFVGGEEAGKFFLKSTLPESVLAQIWDLSDITGSGSLSKDEFAVAMFLINRKNATGAAIPKTLPPSLVPPSLRNRVSAPLPSAFPSQDPIRSMTGSSSHYRRQSFDLLGDGPSLTSSVSTPGLSHTDKDLISDDLKNKFTSESGELASMQNQINNLTNVTGDLQAKRAMLEKNLHVLSAQKQDISIRLNQIKTLYESETRTVKETESAISTIQPQLIKLREELQVSERNLATARANKDEFLLTLAKDQEESAQIKSRLHSNNEEIFKLREELEAKKKDTGRQKGLLEIARRQLESSEAEKQKLINEIVQETESAAQAAKEVQALAAAPSHSPSPSAGSVAPAVPAPRGSRKEPPPPPASRGTSGLASRTTSDVEEAFGIPEALRSPTGSFRSASSHTPGVPQPLSSISRQSTGSTPFDAISRQATGSSPFETLSRQGTGSSPFDKVEPQGTGASLKTPSIAVASEGNNFLSGQDDLWSPRSHAAQVNVGQAPMATSPLPETPFTTQQDSLASNDEDPFGSAFPALNAPTNTKVDFDSAFQGFGASKSSQGFGTNSVKSAEAFAEAFPDLDSVGGDESKSKRVSAFGFEDDFSSSPFSQSLEKSKEEDEFPPIVEVGHNDDDSSDDSDDDNDEKFVQANSGFADTADDPFQVAAKPQSAAPAQSDSHTSESPFSIPSDNAPTQVASTSSEPTAQVTPTPVAPVLTGSSSKKLTAADFSEFENSFGPSNDDLDSAFNGVQLSPPKVSGDGASKISGFDDAFDSFNPSFDDPFGSSSSPFGVTSSKAPTAPSSNAFGAVDLDEAFGGFGVTGTTTGSAPANNGFGDFEAQFSTPTATPAESTPTPTARPPTSTNSTAPKTNIDSTATAPPAPPAVELRGVDELINMGFTRQQAEDALLRYDSVERAANFLLEGAQ
ncbi:hypothetical protein BGZ46_007505, partial [Entomortierella lignicola]